VGVLLYIAAAFPASICDVYLIRGCIHCNENPIYVFLFWELRGLSPNFHIQVSESNLYISRIRIQYKCLVPIYVFPEMNLLFPKQNYNALTPISYTHISVRV
jgi:hypothetical protein